MQPEIPAYGGGRKIQHQTRPPIRRHRSADLSTHELVHSPADRLRHRSPLEADKIIEVTERRVHSTLNHVVIDLILSTLELIHGRLEISIRGFVVTEHLALAENDRRFTRGRHSILSDLVSKCALLILAHSLDYLLPVFVECAFRDSVSSCESCRSTRADAIGGDDRSTSKSACADSGDVELVRLLKALLGIGRRSTDRLIYSVLVGTTSG